jgi:hypothetical protein
MDDWDQETLERVIREKGEREGDANRNLATTIICRFFLDAVEKRQYGWFWKCPNGKECKYRHALPPGYVLKSQMKELLEQEAAERKGRDVTEDIEAARQQVTARTPLTQQVFAAWHSGRIEKRRLEKEAQEAERRKKGLLNGREIFLQEGFVAQDDAAASGADDFKREDDDERAIAEMFERAEAERRAAAEAAGVVDGEEGEEGAGAGAAGGAGAGPSSSSAVPPPIAEGEEEEESEPDDDDDDDDDDDMDDEALAALEAKLQASKV